MNDIAKPRQHHPRNNLRQVQPGWKASNTTTVSSGGRAMQKAASRPSRYMPEFDKNGGGRAGRDRGMITIGRFDSGPPGLPI